MLCEKVIVTFFGGGGAENSPPFWYTSCFPTVIFLAFLVRVTCAKLISLFCRPNDVFRSQWPRGLRRRSAGIRMLRLWVRIPPGTWNSSVMNVVCCEVDVSATS